MTLSAIRIIIQLTETTLTYFHFPQVSPCSPLIYPLRHPRTFNQIQFSPSCNTLGGMTWFTHSW